MIRMFKVMDSACETVNDNLGTSIKFPRPSKRQMKNAQMLNVGTGVVCVAAGLITSYKVLSVIGGINLLGACFIESQLKHFE